MTQFASKPRIALATDADRAHIYALRHQVYAEEIGQYAANAEGRLTDRLDAFNVYLTVHVGAELAGFISVTPPGAGGYSIDKYVARQALPFACDEGTYELRVLTIRRPYRSAGLAAALMYAAFRYVQERGGTQIIAMGRREVLPMYLRHGFRVLGVPIASGQAVYELMEAPVALLHQSCERNYAYTKAVCDAVDWALDYPVFPAPACFHGGAFFEAIGTGFDTLDRRRDIINADVLDAWFPPSPRVIDSLREHLDWLMRTSPPVNSDGLRRAIAHARGVDPANILAGAGSSALIYLAFREWLSQDSRVLILDPSYGEYAHILEKVIGCRVDRMRLAREDGYLVDRHELRDRVQMGYDLVVLVNPNNPTGRHIPRRDLEDVLRHVPAPTRVWIDEAYLEYVGANESLEHFAAASESVIVAKSMSKVYALSGMRVAYLCGPVHQISCFHALTPPWAVSLPAQLAAVRALEDAPYYQARYAETRRLRAQLVACLRELGVEQIVPGEANFVLFHLAPEQPAAAEVARELQHSGVFLRDVSLMGTHIGDRALRIAVKDGPTNARVLQTLERAVCGAAVLS